MAEVAETAKAQAAAYREMAEANKLSVQLPGMGIQFGVPGADMTGPLDEIATKAGAAEEAMAKLTDQTSEWGKTGAAMAGMFQNAFGYLAQSIVIGGASISTAVKRALQGVAVEAGARALFEMASYLAALAWGNPKAGTHLAAAKMYGAAAAAAGVGAGIVGGGGGGGGGSGASASSSGQGGGGVAIIELGSRRYDPRDVDELAALLERVGNRRVIVRRV
jgi:hypothetical protein